MESVMKKIIILITIVLAIAISTTYCYAYQSHTYYLEYNPNLIIVSKTGKIWLANYNRKTIIIINNLTGKIKNISLKADLGGGIFTSENKYILTLNSKLIFSPSVKNKNIVNEYIIQNGKFKLLQSFNIYTNNINTTIMKIVPAKNNIIWGLAEYLINNNTHAYVIKLNRKHEITSKYIIPLPIGSRSNIIIGKHGNIWITTKNNTIIKMSPEGKIIYIDNMFTTTKKNPFTTIALSVGKYGNIWIFNPKVDLQVTTLFVTDKKIAYETFGNNVLLKMNPQGNIIKKYYINNAEFNYNSIIAIGKQGNVWIAIGNDKIMKIIND